MRVAKYTLMGPTMKPYSIQSIKSCNVAGAESASLQNLLRGGFGGFDETISKLYIVVGHMQKEIFRS